MALSLSSWLNVSLMDLLTATPDLSRQDIKEAVLNDDERLQLDLNPLSGLAQQITLQVNSSLNSMIKAKQVSRTRGEASGLDTFKLTKVGEKQQAHFQKNRALIQKPKPRKEKAEPPLPKGFGKEAKALFDEAMTIMMVGSDLEIALDKAQKVIIDALTAIPEVALTAHPTQTTNMGRVVAKNNKLITALKRIALAMQKIERTPEEEVENV